MREFGWSLEYVLKGGYFKAHRCWTMLSELKAGDFFELGAISSIPYLSDEARNNIFENLKRRQPRRHPPIEETVPTEMMEKFKKQWDEVERKQKRG